ncbi:hypothetical protein [Trichocoleus sp. FACHB-262]|uniref:hypothetical protein n=1 Tax=Trichocoleus sp. FACHB-262 TaxID=2692869 RepID=UPI0016853AEF|nr:hypothetical protein [Trichocoleus sp. FACHB-262]MBD2121026.1 hypothetical protein [Trichocoleus sp. FACHB-262]
MAIWTGLTEVIMGKPPKIYPESTANQLSSKLEHLVQNPKGLQVKELVFRLRPKIEAAQESGYTLEDIVNVFKAEGVDLTLNTLKRYLQESRALNPQHDLPTIPALDSKPTKVKKTNSLPVLSSPRSQQSGLPLQEQTRPHLEREMQPLLTNTNEQGFQEMRSDDDL